MLTRQTIMTAAGLALLLSGLVGCAAPKNRIDPNTVARIESAANKADMAASKAEAAARAAADAAAKADAAAAKASEGFKGKMKK